MWTSPCSNRSSTRSTPQGGASPSNVIGFTIGTYLGERTSASLQVNRQKAGSDGILHGQKSLPGGAGFGYRLMADQGLNKRQDAEGSWHTDIAPYTAGVSHQPDISSERLGASGGVELAATVLAIHHGIVPPTINLDNPDPQCDLDYVPNKARPAELVYALSNSFGFGGTNGAKTCRRHRVSRPSRASRVAGFRCERGSRARTRG